MSNIRVSGFFSADDLSRITDAVRTAEGTTSAEIVPYIIERSDDYEEALWRAGALTSSLVLGFFSVLYMFTEIWLPFGLLGVTAVVLLSGALAMLLVCRFPSLRRLLAGRELMNLRVQRMAKDAFVAEEIFRTRGRTGILLFISLLEHEVVVLADAGISSRLGNAQWKPVVESVVRGIRGGKPTEGVLGALHQIADLLEMSGFVKPPDDRNELPDRPRERGRQT